MTEREASCWKRDLLDAELCLKVTPHPPIQRALKHVVDKLQKAGHHVVEWQGPLAKDAPRLMLDFWTADGGEES